MGGRDHGSKILSHINSMSVGTYSFARSNLNKDISLYQKKVFDKFNLNLNQIIMPWKHGVALNKIIREANEDYVIIFDADCIPLDNSFYDILLSQIKDGDTLSGSIGCALHKDKNTAYIHPCFFGFKRSLYYECGAPSLMPYETGDTAQKFTDCCRIKGKKIKFWNATHSNDIMWESPSLNLKLGHGTVFEHVIYHQFQIRKTQQHDSFIQKCKEILNT